MSELPLPNPTKVRVLCIWYDQMVIVNCYLNGDDMIKLNLFSLKWMKSILRIP